MDFGACPNTLERGGSGTHMRGLCPITCRLAWPHTGYENNGLANAIQMIRTSNHLGTPVDEANFLRELEIFNEYLKVCKIDAPMPWHEFKEGFRG